ncbi:transglutaminase domain-containing protein [Floridanema evergladense]|uniref:Transglutaminase domain-containing protein n=1 Tax=Floridaenema evergladense BLCC-F167 TaxID=3153639 RepID=A0ABV4WDF3_9CYAN
MFRTIRPFAAYAIQDISCLGDRLIALDNTTGYLLQINSKNDDSTILNPHQTEEFLDATGLAVWEEKLWFTKDEDVYFCSLTDFIPQLFVSLPYTANGITVWGSTIYVSCQKSGYIYIYDADKASLITRFYTPGIGREHLTIRGEEIWVADDEEQTVFCLERATGEIKFSLLTPFENPTGLVFYHDPETDKEVLYVAYAYKEAYVRDDPNSDPPQELDYRDRTFIHPLYFQYYPEGNYALSNGYLMEVSYVEELSQLEDVNLENLEWRIALPSETLRQKIREIYSIGRPFTEEIINGQRVAVFKFDKLAPQEKHIFGWKALLEVYSIKYRLTPRDVEDLPELAPEFQEKYLVDNDDLAMGTEIILNAAQEAIGTETNLLRKIYKIRNFVYDKLSYGIKPHIDPPDVALERGVGSCGEYLGILLALSRLNGIACRTVGRYKCPKNPEYQNVPLSPDFNHVWMEFYVPGFGWLPMESNPDDIAEGGPYPTRFFMGLSWYHVEIGKGISFENISSNSVLLNKESVSIGDLALNHIRFTILSELPPS